MTVDDILNQSYATLAMPAINASGKADIFYNIIFTKNTEGRLDIYLDSKQFLKNYLLSVDDKNYGYDHIDKDKVVGLINLLNTEEQVSIWKFFKKLCVRYQSEDDWRNYESFYYIAKNKLLKQGNLWYLNPVKLMRFIYFRTVYSYWDLLLFVSIVILLDIVILLPNKYNLWPSTFNVTYDPISQTFWKNHILNVILNLLEFDTGFKVFPLNFSGALIIILSKIFKVIFVVKFLVDKIIKKISFDE